MIGLPANRPVPIDTCLGLTAAAALLTADGHMAADRIRVSGSGRVLRRRLKSARTERGGARGGGEGVRTATAGLTEWHATPPLRTCPGDGMTGSVVGAPPCCRPVCVLSPTPHPSVRPCLRLTPSVRPSVVVGSSRAVWQRAGPCLPRMSASSAVPQHRGRACLGAERRHKTGRVPAWRRPALSRHGVAPDVAVCPSVAPVCPPARPGGV